ncbi:MAG: ECF-type sigma factor [Pseudomonadota bacterium]
MTDRHKLTGLIQDWQNGRASALDDLMPYVYQELKRLARGQMSRESQGHTLQATALVNEAFVKLAGVDINFEDSSHFYGMAATMMRRVLVDHARSKSRHKRGGKARDLTLDEQLVASKENLHAILELDDALSKLSEQDPKLTETIELVFFGGLTYDEAAAAMSISRTAFFNEFQFAKAWLKRELGGSDSS